MIPHVGFANGWALVLLLAVPLCWWLGRKRRNGDERRRIFAATILRSLVFAAVALALAGPYLQTRSRDLSVVYAFDVSASVEPAFVRQALDWARQATARYQPAQARYVVFADRAELLRELADVGSVAVRTADAGAGTEGIDQSATDIELAIRSAMLGFLPGSSKRLVLISDGKQTQGDVWRELPRLQAERVRVFALPAQTAFGAQAWIDEVEAAEGVRQQEPVVLRVRLRSNVSAPARLQLSIAGNAIFDRKVELVPGRIDVPVELRFKRTGANPVQVKFVPPGGVAETGSQSVWVGPRLRLLAIEGDPASARYLAEGLSAQGIDVRRVTPEQFTDDPAHALRAADAVVLNDVPAARFNADGMAALERFVRDMGGGLVFVAGENAYGKAGFSGSGLERMLPVKFEARRKRKELDLVLLIDRSYSMFGRKLELAKSASLATLDLMDEEHRLAVIAFDSQPHDVVMLAPVGSKRRAEDAIGGMTASGRTDIYNALWRAREVLKSSRASTKHIILLSDGQTVPPPNAAAPAAQTPANSEMVRMLHNLGYGQGEIDRLVGDEKPTRPAAATGGFEELVADMGAANITLSTIAIGDKPNLPLLDGLAQWGNGKAYVAQRDTEIPALFVTEARRLLGDSLIEERFRPVAKGRSAVLSGLDFAAGPELKGFVATKPKRFADVLLEAKQQSPVLAETRYGLGKTVAFLSDAKNRWASEWIAWPGYAKFWAQVVRDAARGAATQELAWQVTRVDREAVLTLTALNPDGSYRNDLWPKVRVERPDGRSTVVPLRQSAPGSYANRIALGATSETPYRFELLAGPSLPAEQVAAAGVRTLYYASSDEARPRPPDVETLQMLSERTGGKLGASTAEIFAPAQDGGMQAKALWPAFAAAALLLFMLEIVVRRVHWSVLDGAIARSRPRR